MFGLRDQMRRAAVSIPSNIAEGTEWGGRDFARFARMALGSAAELRTQLYIARRIDLLSADNEAKQLSRMLNALRKSLDPNRETEPRTEH